MKMPELTDDEMDLMPLYSACVTEMGVGEKDYLATQLWHSSVVGSFSASVNVRSHLNSLEKLHGNISFSAKGLASNQTAMTDLMYQSMEQTRFDELPRLSELVAQIRSHRESSVIGNGHVMAMIAAASGLSANAHLTQRWSGLTGLSLLKSLDDRLDEEGLQKLAAQLKTIHKKVLAQPRQLLVIAEQERLDVFSQQMQSGFKQQSSIPFSNNSLIEYRPNLTQVNRCWTANTQVSFCAKAYPTVAVGHPDAAALTVLGGVLRNGYLHRAIREQGGAYGGGASQDSQSGAFRFFSYRDPRIQGTLNDFDQSIDWLANQPLGSDKIEEAVLGVIGNLDKPSSPAGEAMQAFHAELSGRSKTSALEFRKRVLDVKDDDLKRVADKYLCAENAHTAVITNTDLAADTGLHTIAV